MSAISIIGAGSRWTALAQVLADNAHQTILWSCDEKEVHLINSCHINPAYLAERVLPDSVIATTDLTEALLGTEYLLIAVPSKAFSLVLEKIQPYYTGQQVIIATKGLSASRELFHSQQAQRILQTDKVALLSGPSHAEEVIQRMPTWVSLVSPDLSIATKLWTLFQNTYFHTETSSDLIGIQISATLKNILALLCGYSDGKGGGINQKAVIVTKGIQEIGKMVKKCWGQTETLYGISGLGDVVVTALSPFSRNRQAGKLLAEGKTPDQIRSQISMTIESFSALESLPFLLNGYEEDFPLLTETLQLLQGKSPELENIVFS